MVQEAYRLLSSAEKRRLCADAVRARVCCFLSFFLRFTRGGGGFGGFYFEGIALMMDVIERETRVLGEDWCEENS